MKKNYNWGIMGPGFIANKVMPDFSYAAGANVMAAGSNTPGKGRKFAEKWNIERVYDNYPDLVKDPDVDIIYITTPNGFHCDNAILAMNHGKHVICEKPFAMNGKSAREMAACARENKVFLMDGMWTRFFPAVQTLKRLVEGGIVGEVNMIVSAFSYDYPFDPEYHLFDPKAGGGTLLDGGIYPLTFAGFICGSAPVEYTGFANLKNGVDIRDSVILRFANGAQASFICGADTASPWMSTVYGSKGCIRVPDFYAPETFEVEIYETGEKKTHHFPFEGQGYQFEMMEVMRCLDLNKTESDIMPLDETIAYIDIIDQLRKKWGVIFPGD